MSIFRYMVLLWCQESNSFAKVIIINRNTFFFFSKTNSLFVMSITFETLDQGWAKQDKMSQKQGLNMTLNKAKHICKPSGMWCMELNWGTFTRLSSCISTLGLGITKLLEFIGCTWRGQNMFKLSDIMGKILMRIIKILHYYWDWGAYHQKTIWQAWVCHFSYWKCACYDKNASYFNIKFSNDKNLYNYGSLVIRKHFQ